MILGGTLTVGSPTALGNSGNGIMIEGGTLDMSAETSPLEKSP